MIKWNNNLLHNCQKWMEIDERVLNEIFVYLCSDNPDILWKTVLIFSKCSFCGFVMWERRTSIEGNNEWRYWFCFDKCLKKNELKKNSLPVRQATSSLMNKKLISNFQSHFYNFMILYHQSYLLKTTSNNEKYQAI